MIETYLIVIAAVIAGFAITGLALFAARHLAAWIDRRRAGSAAPTDKPEQDETTRADDS
jgi:hypothetical protein